MAAKDAPRARLRRTFGHLLPKRTVEEGGEKPKKKPVIPDPEGYEGSRAPWKPGDPLPRPLTRDTDPPGADKLGLSPEEIKQFKELGYVVKRGLIPAEDLQEFRDLWWQMPPVKDAGMIPEDPATWVAPGQRWPRQERQKATVAEGAGRHPHNLDRNGHVWRWHGIGHDERFLHSTSCHPNVLHMVEALIGGPVRRPRRNRGIYSVFPKEADRQMAYNPRGGGGGLGPHIDGVPIDLMAVTFVDKVGIRSGGFTIWPGSSKLLYPTSQQALNWVPTERSKVAMEQIIKTIEPREFTGEAGDVIFAHGLTTHSVGIQESGKVRLACIQDFQKCRPRGPLVCRALGKNGGVGASMRKDGTFVLPTNNPDDPADDPARDVMTPWHIDGMEWAAQQHPPREDMWEDWNLGTKPVVGNVVDEPSWWDKYDFTIEGPRGFGGLPAMVGGPRNGGVPLSRIAKYEGNGVWRAKLRGNEWRGAEE